MMDLRVSGLGVELGDTSPVWEVTFSAPPGALVGIAGPQGSGKSTLLRILAGLVVPDHGEAVLADVDLVADPAWARTSTGYVGEQAGLYPDMTAAEYLDFMAACHGTPPAERAALVQDLLDVVDVAADGLVEALSRGARQRLAVARALVHDPTLLLLDEPFAGLDPRSRLELTDLLHELRGMGKIVLLCTADVATLDGLATHVGLMNGGRLVAFGTREEILARGRRARFLDIRVGGDPEAIANVVRAQPTVRAVLIEGSLLRVSFIGGDGAAQSILATLVRSGTPIGSFVDTRGGLEEALRQIMEG